MATRGSTKSAPKRRSAVRVSPSRSKVSPSRSKKEPARKQISSREYELFVTCGLQDCGDVDDLPLAEKRELNASEPLK
jgi:hypothetical protein